MVNASNVEVASLGGSGLTVQLLKPGTTSFAATTGSKNEVGNGWYELTAEPSESDTRGEIAIKVTGSGALQQNLVYMIGDPREGFGATAHTIQIVVDGSPVDGAEVWITTDSAGNNIVAGTLTTNSDGNVTFYLDSGTYYSWVQHGSNNFTNPTEFSVA
jgi:hypothetical protein